MAVTPNFSIPLYTTSDTAKLDTLLNGQATALDTNLKAAIDGLKKDFVAAVSSAGARDAIFPSPAQGNRVYRTDLGYEEGYFAVYNVTTNPNGATVAGWYPTTAGAIRGTVHRTATTLTLPNGAYASASATSAWAAGPSEKFTGGLTYSDGWIPPVSGNYQVDWTLIGGGAFAAGLQVNTGTVTSFENLRAGQSSGTGAAMASGSTITYIAAGQYVRLFGVGLSGAVNVGTGTGSSFSISYVDRPVG